MFEEEKHPLNSCSVNVYNYIAFFKKCFSLYCVFKYMAVIMYFAILFCIYINALRIALLCFFTHRHLNIFALSTVFLPSLTTIMMILFSVCVWM